jgi:hypothetical protein
MRSFARSSTGHYRFGVSGVSETLRDFMAPSFSQTVRRVCRSCNNGWMSTMEEEMKEIAVRVRGGRDVVFGSVEQAVVAKWILKTALVIALLYDHNATKVEPGHYGTLASGDLPPNTTVWLGRYDGVEMEAGSWLQRFAWEAREEPTAAGEGYIFLTSALSLVGFGIVMGGSVDVPPGVRMGDRMVAAFRRIWPPSHHYGVVWPPSPPVTLAELTTALEEFRRMGGDHSPTSLVPR